MTTATKIPVTYFAPAERVPIAIVHRQAATFSETPLTAQLLNSVLNYVFILNPQRQIVFASQNVLDLTPGKESAQLLGLRPGEALDCIHAHECENGCGTAEFCRLCGAARAVLTGLTGQRDLQECRMTRLIHCEEEALDLLVLAAPLVHDGEKYCLLSVADITHEKRRRALERIFFHDVINLAGGVDGLLETLETAAPADLKRDLALTQAAMQDLLEEVLAQRDLAAAERDELAVAPTALNSGEVLEEVKRVYQKHPAAAGRLLVPAPQSAVVSFVSDATLLRRVLGNLAKNALEASRPGQAVTLGCELAADQVRFTVHNPTAMPREVQMQMFNRSFSTKGYGRGLGAYSAKLLTERHLKGRIHFTSTPEQGTAFCVTLPKTIEGKRD